MGEQEKIKIAIATHKMVMGGIEKSLIDLCKLLLGKGYEVTLYLECVGGELYNKIPNGIKVVYIFERYQSMAMILKNSLCQRKFMSMYAAFCAYIRNHFNGDPVQAWENTVKYLDNIDVNYDYAFAYGAPVSFSVLFVSNLIKGKKKFAWIHNDVGQLTLDITKYSDIFEVYDKIVCVSKKSKETFLKYLPEYKSKTTVFYNIIDKENILQQAKEYVYSDTFSGLRLLTVGRLCYQKGQDLIPKLTKRLISAGYNIRWYCVGEGEDREILEAQIRTLEMESKVILLGNQQNPYPFLMADIYIQPSRNEGFGITISEAKIFSLPIISTDFDGANEQITDGETGLIVPFDENEIYKALVYILDNKDVEEKFKVNLLNDKKRCESNVEELMD